MTTRPPEQARGVGLRRAEAVRRLYHAIPTTQRSRRFAAPPDTPATSVRSSASTRLAVTIITCLKGYGTPGIARAQQIAAIATGDAARQQIAEHTLAVCLSDTAQLSRITDSSLCHGWAGLYQTACKGESQ